MVKSRQHLIYLYSILTKGSAWINEFHYDNAGSDIGEFIEVGCNTAMDLTGYSLVLYNGSNGGVYNTIALDGQACAPPDAFHVEDLPANGLQNGSPDGIALVDPDGEVTEFISYEGELEATDGPAAGEVSVDVGVSESSSATVGTSLQLVGTGCEAADFTWVGGDITESKGDVNEGQTISCVSVNEWSATCILNVIKRF